MSADFGSTVHLAGTIAANKRDGETGALFNGIQGREEREGGLRAMIDVLPAAAYTTDAEGRLTHFNAAAAEMAGRVPQLGIEQWCLSWKMFRADGTPLPHDQCPMAVALREKRAIRGEEIIVERPDGVRAWVAPYPTPLFDEAGQLVGGFNLVLDITERKESQAGLAAEADALSELNELSSRLWQMRSLQDGLNEMLEAMIRLVGADMGNIQILDANRDVLTIEAQRGFKQDFLDQFREVAAHDDSACGRALRSGERIVIEDVQTDAPYAQLREIARSAGYRSVQSTPLIGRAGAPLGMISTHWRVPHRPSEHELRRLDLYARQASDFIERCQADEILHATRSQLERELADTKLLQRLSADMARAEDAQSLYEKIMDAAVQIMHADFASMQMLYPERGVPGGGGELRLLAFRGYNPQAAAAWEWISADHPTTCGVAFRTGTRCLVSDVEQCEWMAGSEDLELYLQTGVRSVQSTPLFSRSGAKLGMISTCWSKPHDPSDRDWRMFGVLARHAADLIERTLATTALRESESYVRQIVQSSPDCVKVLDLGGRLVSMNPAGVKLMELSSDSEMLGRDWTEFWSPTERGAARRALESVRGGETSTFQGFCPTSTGKPKWWDVVLSPVRDEQGPPRLILAVSRDITERKQAEQALRQSESRARAIFENAGVSLWEEDFSEVRAAIEEWKAQGVTDWQAHFHTHPELVTQAMNLVKVLDVNDATVKMFQARDKDELLGSLPAIFVPESMHVFVGELIALAEGEPYFEAEALLRTLRGNSIHVLFTMVTPDARDPLQRVLFSVFDITDRKQVELALRESEERLRVVAEERTTLLESERAARSALERVDRQKDEFLATVSHELRTPLNAILGWAQLLRRGSMAAADIAQGLEVIERSARSQARLIEDLFETSRDNTGKMTLEAGPADLAALVSAAAAAIEPAAADKHITLHKSLASATVKGDAGRLQQVCSNLLSNAVKFTPAGGNIFVRMQRIGNFVELVVADDGAGISAEFLPHVFDQFRQQDPSTTRGSGGLGLGLAIVKTIVTLHGGSVSVASAGKDKGATFTVTLPVSNGSPVRSDKATDPSRSEVDAFETVTLDGVRALVVDDQADARELIGRVLAGVHARVVGAGSVQEAIHAFSENPPEILISDIGMNGEDGYELIRRIRALPADRGGCVPAIALTAYARSEDQAKAILAGYSAHVAKPIRPAELVAVTAELLGRPVGREPPGSPTPRG